MVTFKNWKNSAARKGKKVQAVVNREKGREGKILFLKNLALWCTTPHGKKTKEPIPIKRLDKPYSKNPSGHDRWSNKRISQMREIAVDNKNTI